MKLLLDTHVFLWLDQAAPNFPIAVREWCESPDNEVFLSVASIWELQIKRMLGKLQTRLPIKEMVEAYLPEQTFSVLSIQMHHIWCLASLPGLHADPFDRLLIAQARCERMKFVSADAKLREYPVEVLWS